MRRVCGCVLVASFTISPLSAQSLKDSIASAAAHAAVQQAAAEEAGKIPPGYKWTGIALLATGAYLLILGAATDRTGETCATIDYCISNATLRTSRLIGGAAAAGVGGAVLAIGVSKSHQAPSISFGPHGLVVRTSMPINVARTRAHNRHPRR